MRKVLIPTDFSEIAMNAVRYAFQLFEGNEEVGETEYVLLNAYDIPHGGSATMLVSISDILKRDSENGLKQCLKDLNKEGDKHRVRTISMHGDLTSVIQQILKKEDFNAIIMGTHGAGGFRKILGSGASEVIKKIKIPVLIVPKGAKYERPDKILLTTDFKPIRRDNQIERLRNFSAAVNGEILILNVHEERNAIDIEKAKLSSGLEVLLQGVKHSYHDTINDDIIAGIDDFVEKNDIKILAMILRQLNFIDSIFHKSLTKEMAMQTKIPMLALHD